jgi:DNA modification methylase
VEYVDIDRLQPNPANPRIMPRQEMQALEHSVDHFGLVDPIIVRRQDISVIGGHQRIAAARSLGLTQVPVIFVDVSEEEAKVLSLALNKISGAWDEHKLAELLRELDGLAGLDLSVAGFDDEDIKAYLAALEAEVVRHKEENFDFEAAIQEARDTSRVQRGEVWALGRHRLMCGDAGSSADLGKLLAADIAHVVVTDPPYNVDYRPEGSPSGRTGGRKGRGQGNQTLGPIENDRMSPEQYQAFLDAAFDNVVTALAGGGAVYVFGGVGTCVAYTAAFEAAGLHLSSVIVWDKGSLVLTRKDYHSEYELIYYGWRADKPHAFYGGRSQTDIWRVQRDSPRTYQHPTQKPVELMERCIENSSRPGQTVLDPCVGSGTTIIAAERTGRRCLAMDIDPRFAEVALRRWESFTGRKARKVT